MDRFRAMLAGCVGALMIGMTTLAGGDPGAKPFPDDWFFEGAQRPAPLKALEGKAAGTLSIDSWIGTETTIAGSKGKVVVVDFWATWCGPCMASIPHNIDLVKKYQDQGLVFIGVHDSNSGWDKADQVVKDKGINYPVGVDKTGGPSATEYAVQFWPTYIVIDRAGVIRGAGLVPGKVEDAVKQLLAEDAPAAGATSAAAAEFAADHYLGGAGRPKGLKEIEGKAAPKFKAAAWSDTDPGEAAWKDNVVIAVFVSPTLGVSLSELEKVAALQKDLASQGVSFVAVVDGRADDAGWKKVLDHAKAKKLAMPMMRDQATRKNDAGKLTVTSDTALAFGVEFFPTTVIVDRNGKVRAAGIKADKVKAVAEKLLAERVGEAGAGGAKDEKAK